MRSLLVRNTVFFLTLLLVEIIAVPASAQTADDLWFTNFKGPAITEKNVTAGITEVAVIGDKVFVAGYFTKLGGDPFERIAMWDGQKWNKLGTGLNGSVLSLAKDADGNLYAGGEFTQAGGIAANHIAKWNGTAWSAVGTGTSVRIHDILFDPSGIMYVAGQSSGGEAIARWNGTTWTGIGSANSIVECLAYVNSKLYVGGFFTDIDGVSVSRIASWNGTVWAPLGTGVVDRVNAMTSLGNDLYITGNFTTANGVAAKNFAKWDGTNFSAMGTGGEVGSVLATSPDGLIYTVSGGDFQNNIATWDGTTWTQTMIKIFSPYDLVFDGANIFYAAGNFRLASNSSQAPYADGILKVIDRSKILTLNENLNQEVFAVATIGSDLYVAGSWNAIGGQPTPHRGISKWDGFHWTPVGPPGTPTDQYFQQGGVYINKLTTDGINLYAAGVIRGFVQMFDGTKWNTLGKGLDNFPEPYGIGALAVRGKYLYAGGKFGTADEKPVNNIAVWNGVAWSGLGTGVDGKVWAIAIKGNDVYVGGDFTHAGGVDARSLARWDGTAWHAVGTGTGINGAVKSIVIRGSDIYIAGDFQHTDGLLVDRVARWDGSFHALGDGLNSTVNAIAFGGNKLYATGKFNMSGFNNIKGIAIWNGTAWSQPGSGITGADDGYEFGNSLALGIGTMYIGGNFRLAGGKGNAFLAGIHLDSDDDLIADLLDNCPNVSNLNQANTDSDLAGNVCDCDANNATVGSKFWYHDSDNDGFGDINYMNVSCTKPVGFVELPGDCDDNDASSTIPTTWFADVDKDGYGDGAVEFESCFIPLGFVSNSTDCNDADSKINPVSIWYKDADGDGFGAETISQTQCTKPVGFVSNKTDCDDTNAAVSPNTIWIFDSDGDGFGGESKLSFGTCFKPSEKYVTVGGDCDDNNNKRYPGAPKVANGLDNDCDGVVEFVTQVLTFPQIADVELTKGPFTPVMSSNAPGAVLRLESVSDHITVSNKTTVTPVSPGQVLITLKSDQLTGFTSAETFQYFCITPAKPSVTVNSGNGTASIQLLSTTNASYSYQWFLNGNALPNEKSAALTVTSSAPGVYKVQVDVQGCKSKFSDDFPVIVTGDLAYGIGENGIYPNPVNDKLFIALPGNKGSNIDIIHMNGTHSGGMYTTQKLVEMNVTDYSPGVYLLKVNGPDKVFIARFVKQ